MAETVLDGVAEGGEVSDTPREQPRGRLGRPRADVGEPQLITPELARHLLERARAEGLDVTRSAVRYRSVIDNATI